MRLLLVLAVLIALWASPALAAKQVGSCSVTPASAGPNGAFTITATANILFAFYVQSPDGVKASWPQAGPGAVVTYSYPPSAEYYPLQVGSYAVVVEGFVGKHGRKEIGRCAFTVVP